MSETATNQSTKLVKISGLVILVKNDKNDKVTWNGQKYSQIKVETLQSKTRYLCLINFFLPVEKYEYISAFGTQVSDKYIIISQKPQPYVMLSISKREIENCMIKALRGKKVGYFKIGQIYEHLESLIESGVFTTEEESDLSSQEALNAKSMSSRVSAVMTQLAEQYHNYFDPQALEYFKVYLDREQTQFLLNWWYRNRELRRLYLLGLYNREINDCHLPASRIYERCKDNPFSLPGIPMEKAANISQSLGITITPQMFDCGNVIRAIHKAMRCGGHVGMSLRRMEKLQPRLMELLPVLKEKYAVVCDYYTLYLEQAYEAESYIVEFIARQIKERDLIQDDDPFDSGDGLDPDETPCLSQGEDQERDELQPKEPSLVDPRAPPQPCRLEITSTSDIELTEDQTRAVQGALDHPISIITGPPGTGKTSVIRQIVHNLELRDCKYWLASFTGKAVSRIKEVVGRHSGQVMTIHRLIGSVKKFIQEKTGESTTAFEHLIIDEFSMVDTRLFYDLLYSTRKIGFRLTLVGDKDQLAPIDWGQSFGSMIKSQRIPIYYLEKCHRVYDVEGETDGITLNARLILQARRDLPLKLEETANFRLLEGDIFRVKDIVQEFFQQMIKPQDFIICCPYNRHLPELNEYCQEIYDEGQKKQLDFRGDLWRVGDKVLQKRNDYDADVFNGQVGYIIEVNNRGVQVKFDEDQLVTYPFRQEKERNKTSGLYTSTSGRFSNSMIIESDENPLAPLKERTIADISLGYAGTVHSWQGSEANYVIFYVPLTEGVNRFVNQTLIYTAITRAKRACYVISEDLEGFAQCCKQPPSFRLDNLSKRISELLPEHPTNVCRRQNLTNEAEIDDLDDFDDFNWEDY